MKQSSLSTEKDTSGNERWETLLLFEKVRPIADVCGFVLIYEHSITFIPLQMRLFQGFGSSTPSHPSEL